MPSIEVINIKKEKVGVLDLNEALFGAKVDGGLIHEAVVMQLASRRQGTAATKTRGKVRGGGRKPWRQKGTGRARAGSTRSPIWRGGGTTFGPQPRSYAYAFPRKKYRVALRSALSAKVRDGEVMIVDGLGVSEPKTREIWKILETLGVKGTVLIVYAQLDENLDRAARNLPFVHLVPVEGLNVYELITANRILLSKEAVAKIEEVWA